MSCALLALPFRLLRPLRVTLLVDRTALPEERVVWLEPLPETDREVDPEVLRAVEEPLERLVRVFWSTVPAERVVEEPAERLTEELEPVERLVEVPELRLVEEPVLREVRSFCTKEERLGAALAERLVEVPEERLTPDERLDETEPEDRLMEEDPRVAVCEEDDRDAEEAPPERRVWA